MALFILSVLCIHSWMKGIGNNENEVKWVMLWGGGGGGKDLALHSMITFEATENIIPPKTKIAIQKCIWCTYILPPPTTYKMQKGKVSGGDRIMPLFRPLYDLSMPSSCHNDTDNELFIIYLYIYLVLALPTIALNTHTIVGYLYYKHKSKNTMNMNCHQVQSHNRKCDGTWIWAIRYSI